MILLLKNHNYDDILWKIELTDKWRKWIIRKFQKEKAPIKIDAAIRIEDMKTIDWKIRHTFKELLELSILD